MRLKKPFARTATKRPPKGVLHFNRNLKEHQRSTGVFGAVAKVDLARYTADQLNELIKLARSEGLVDLAYVLEMALLEARQQAGDMPERGGKLN